MTAPPSSPPLEQAPPTPASAEAFRAHQASPVYLTLPESGLVVEVRRAHVAELAEAGRIPDHLTPYLLRRLGQPGPDPDPPASLPDALRPNRELVDAVCCASLAAPRMVPEDTPLHEHPDALRPRDMPYRDREHVYLYACRLVEASTPRRFPGGPARGVEPVAHGQDVQDAAE